MLKSFLEKNMAKTKSELSKNTHRNSRYTTIKIRKHSPPQRSLPASVHEIQIEEESPNRVRKISFMANDAIHLFKHTRPVSDIIRLPSSDPAYDKPLLKLKPALPVVETKSKPEEFIIYKRKPVDDPEIETVVSKARSGRIY